MGKYVSAMVAAGARLTYTRQSNHLWFGIVLVTSVVATVYQLYWDFVKDWGLLNPKSKNPWLRDDLILKNKSIYYISIVSHSSQSKLILFYHITKKLALRQWKQNEYITGLECGSKNCLGGDCDAFSYQQCWGAHARFFHGLIRSDSKRALEFLQVLSVLQNSLSRFYINVLKSFWNRLENEHLNNVGKFRAVKAVPLPFHEIDSDYWWATLLINV